MLSISLTIVFLRILFEESLNNNNAFHKTFVIMDAMNAILIIHLQIKINLHYLRQSRIHLKLIT